MPLTELSPQPLAMMVNGYLTVNCAIELFFLHTQRPSNPADCQCAGSSRAWSLGIVLQRVAIGAERDGGTPILKREKLASADMSRQKSNNIPR